VDHPADVPGDGREWEWSGVTSILEEGFPVMLAGGLNPENIEAALSSFQKVLPWGVDVASGVELDGRKDLDRMKAFVDSIRALEAEF
jgi:phosphoribosylanthranilate isomerase